MQPASPHSDDAVTPGDIRRFYRTVAVASAWTVVGVGALGFAVQRLSFPAASLLQDALTSAMYALGTGIFVGLVGLAGVTAWTRAALKRARANRAEIDARWARTRARHMLALARYARYETDPAQALAAPHLHDLTHPESQQLVKLLRAADRHYTAYTAGLENANWAGDADSSPASAVLEYEAAVERFEAALARAAKGAR